MSVTVTVASTISQGRIAHGMLTAGLISAMTRQLLADHSRNQASCQHSVCDAPLKNRITRVIVIEMNGVTVGGHFGK